MQFRDIPIKRKLTSVIMLASSIVLLVTCLAFVTYDLITFRREMTRNLATLAQVIAANSAAAVAFIDEGEARGKLASLKAKGNIVAAALYDKEGKLFSEFPASEPAQTFPVRPGADGPRFVQDSLVFFEPVVREGERLGTLYLKSDLQAMYALIRLYCGIVLLVMASSFLLAFALSRVLQKGISQPILELAGTAKAVSDRKDYSVRARKYGQDELGQLTDSFNAMLTLIHERDVSLRESAERLRLALEASQTGTWDWNFHSRKLSWDEYMFPQFGLRRAEFADTYEAFLKCVHPDNREQVNRAIASAVQQKSEFNLEFRVLWPDGTVHDIAARGKAFYDDAGKAVRMAGVSLDVTQRRRAEEEIRRLNAELEQRALERERARIARDIHDDLGASLTRISMLSQSVRSEVKGLTQAANDTDQIHSTAREITRAMDEIVWAVNPKYDTLDSLAAYIGRFAQQYLGAAALRCRLKIPVELPPLALSAEVRHNVFLAFKEALNNVVKHAQATEVFISLELRPTEFVLVVDDNGRGFQRNAQNLVTARGDSLRSVSGHGLPNMERRLEEIGGSCVWGTPPGGGTRIAFTVLIKS